MWLKTIHHQVYYSQMSHQTITITLYVSNKIFRFIRRKGNTKLSKRL